MSNFFQMESTIGNGRRILNVFSNGGVIVNQPLMCKIGTIPIMKNPHIWKRKVKEEHPEITHEDILNLIPKDIMEEPDNSNIDGENISDVEDNISDISNNTNNSENTESNILRSLLN